MSCNGCRVLRKGCSDSCILRPCLQWIESPESQGHATVFVAKFFGRAGLMSFISAVSENQRPALFQSLLFEACGRTVNPINGAVGLLWTGNWHVCQRAVETVLRGGSLRPANDGIIRLPESDEASEVRDPYFRSKASTTTKRKGGFMNEVVKLEPSDLNLSLTGVIPSKVSKVVVGPVFINHRPEKRRSTTPSMTSDQESVTTSESVAGDHSRGGERKLLRLFV